jgi:Tat protein secretion system quality control protein TatD with DNase activity
MNNNATSSMEYFDIHTHTPAREHSIYDCGTLYVPDMTISVGIHPWHIPPEWEETFAAIEAVAAEKNVVAIGECGIDKLRGATETEIQKKVFLAHAMLAEKVRKPLIVHCVKSFDEIIEIRKQMSPSQAWIIHGFRGKPQQAAQLLVGKHDFKNFSTAKKSKSTVRNVTDIEIYGDLEEIQITIQADDFLHNMARLIIGTLLDIGLGNRKKEDIEKIFAGKAAVSEPCDPKGLFLQEINY